MKKLLVATLLILIPSLEAKIYLDYEVDPLPLVKVEMLSPSTRLSRGDTENLGLQFLQEFYESGTNKLSRQKFQDALASYGASLEINPAYQYASISATFPLSGGKVPKGLSELIRDNWESPRMDKPSFDRSKSHLKANYIGTLDRDSSLLGIGLQKVMATALFGLHPYSLETFSRIKLEDIQEIQKTYYDRKGDIWVGVIGPAELKKDVIEMVQTVFPGAGPIQEGIRQQKLESGYKPEQKGLLKPTFLIIDKKDLAQIHYGFIHVSQKKRPDNEELIDKFSYYVLAGSGVDSLFGKRIREEKGLAYVVSGIMHDYYDYPVISMYSNPQRNKQAEAFDVLQNLIKDTFESGKVISTTPDPSWTGWLTAYRNAERQNGATPEGRLDRRKDIVTGDLSYALYQTPIDDWNVRKGNAITRLKELSGNSSMIVGALGDSTELAPLVKKYFPNYEVIKVNFKDIISDSWLKKK